MIYEAFPNISMSVFLFYDSICDLIVYVYESAEFDHLETTRLTNLPHVYVLYV